MKSHHRSIALYGMEITYRQSIELVRRALKNKTHSQNFDEYTISLYSVYVTDDGITTLYFTIHDKDGIVSWYSSIDITEGVVYTPTFWKAETDSEELNEQEI